MGVAYVVRTTVLRKVGLEAPVYINPRGRLAASMLRAPAIRVSHSQLTRKTEACLSSRHEA